LGDYTIILILLKAKFKPKTTANSGDKESRDTAEESNKIILFHWFCNTSIPWVWRHYYDVFT